MDRDEKRIQEDIAIAKDPNTWGCWPILPMKRVGRCEPPVIGFLLATGKPKLYLKNFLDLRDLGIQTLKEVDEKIQAKEYSSFEAIFDDGWVVD